MAEVPGLVSVEGFTESIEKSTIEEIDLEAFLRDFLLHLSIFEIEKTNRIVKYCI